MRIAHLGGFQIELPRSKHYTLSMVQRVARERREAGVFQTPGNHCVYVYCDADNHVFYIGKGTPERPNSRHDHPIFTRYVNEELAGHYSVHVLEIDLSNDAAEELEQDLLEVFGTGCVNWVDFYSGETEDEITAREKQSVERRAHAEVVRKILDEIKLTQRTNPKAAIAHCRRLIDLQAAWEDAEVAREREGAERRQQYSLKAALSLKWDDFRPTHNAAAGDAVLKLTALLIKERQWTEVIASVNWLEQRYSGQFSGHVAKREQALLARRQRAATELARSRAETT